MKNDPNKTHFREADFQRSAIDLEKRTVQLAFSSETPCRSYFEDFGMGMEVLDHSQEASADLSRINNSAPFVYDHCTSDFNRQIGVVVPGSVKIDTAERVGRATVLVKTGPVGDQFLADAAAGIRTKVSFGYRRTADPVPISVKDGVTTFRVMGWLPIEISSVAVPADDTVGVGRSEPTETNQKRNDMPEENKETPVVTVGENTALTAEKKRCETILAIAAKHNCMDIASEFIRSGEPVESFQERVLTTRYGAAKVDTAKPQILSEKDAKQYSLSRAIMTAAGKRSDGFEFEVSQEIAKQRRQDPNGFFVPEEILRTRALNATSATAGGFLVATNQSGDVVDLLRNRTVVEMMGARKLTGLVGNVTIPKIAGAATAYWLPENGEVTASDQSFGQLALTPHRLIASTEFSKELLVQSSLSVENLVRDDLNKVTSLKLDLAALSGSGASGEPIGILNTNGLSTAVSFGGAATWAKVVSFETNVATSNADYGTLAFVTSPAVRGKWKTILKASNVSGFLWENGTNGDGMVNGYRALVTNQIALGKVIFGNWADLILASWAGVDVVVDPYSLATTGKIKVTMTQYADVGIRHPASFCVSSDSGAQ